MQPEVMVALVRSPRTLPDARRVLPDVQLSAEPRQWTEVAGDAEAASRLRVYAGYAGWGCRAARPRDAPGLVDRREGRRPLDLLVGAVGALAEGPRADETHRGPGERASGEDHG